LPLTSCYRRGRRLSFQHYLENRITPVEQENHDEARGALMASRGERPMKNWLGLAVFLVLCFATAGALNFGIWKMNP